MPKLIKAKERDIVKSYWKWRVSFQMCDENGKKWAKESVHQLRDSSYHHKYCKCLRLFDTGQGQVFLGGEHNLLYR